MIDLNKGKLKAQFWEDYKSAYHEIEKVLVEHNFSREHDWLYLQSLDEENPLFWVNSALSSLKNITWFSTTSCLNKLYTFTTHKIERFKDPV